MMQNLFQMTNIELKQYISEHRNNDDAFHSAMEVLISRRNPANLHPYPFDLPNSKAEVEALLRERLSQAE